MEAFDCVGRVDQLTNRWVVFKIRAELCPVIPPRGDDNGILFAPLLVKGIKLLFSEFFRGRLIDFFEIGQEWLLIFTGNILQAVSDLMHTTALNLSFREGRLNRFSKPLRLSMQAIRISSSPRFRRSERTPSQKFAPSLSETYMPSNSLRPS